MGEKRKRIYNALVEGATSGLSDKALYSYVQEQCPKTSGKRLVRASLLALTDPHVMDRNVLNTIYALAIKQRVDAAAFKRKSMADGGDPDIVSPAAIEATMTVAPDDAPAPRTSRTRKSRAPRVTTEQSTSR